MPSRLHNSGQGPARQYAGVHLSGPNTPKTSVVVLRGQAYTAPLEIVKVYEKIGAFGTLFSDERLVEILSRSGPFAEVFVDCPLTVPPCVACQRPRCPGAMQCDDVAVAYMLAISSKVRRKGARKARPINPQSQRLWDVLQLETPPSERPEPSYSANLAPLVARAVTLQRRLNALDPALVLKETAVPMSLEASRQALGLPARIKQSYRNFEDGGDERWSVVERLVERGWLARPSAETLAAVTDSVETFQALVTAWVASLHHAGMTNRRSAGFIASEGWVYLPEMSSRVEIKPRFFE